MPPRRDQPRREPAEGPGGSRTCCFMVFVSHSSSLPGTWLAPLLPTSGAEGSTWEGKLGAAAEQTKEAPLGLQARDRILQHTTREGGMSWTKAQQRACGRAQGGAWPPAHRGMSSLMLISQRFFLASVS